MPIFPSTRPRLTRPLLSCLVAGSLLAGCSANEDTDAVVPTPAPTLTTNPVMTTAPDGSAMTPGAWEIGEDALGAHARFQTPDSETIVALECNVATQGLTLMRAGDATGPQTFVLDAGGQRASLDMTPTGGDMPVMEAQINKAMPVFAAFSQIGNAITMTSPTGEVVRLPGAPGIERVIDACSR